MVASGSLLIMADLSLGALPQLLAATGVGEARLVPLAGIEPALLAELDFEFERVYQFRHRGLRRGQRAESPGSPAKPADYSQRPGRVNPH